MTIVLQDKDGHQHTRRVRSIDHRSRLFKSAQISRNQWIHIDHGCFRIGNVRPMSI